MASFRPLARSFSTSQVSQQLVKAPVQVFGTDGRYATALYSAATKLKQLDGVEKELISFQQALKTDVKFRDFVLDPTIQKSLKIEALKIVGQKKNFSAASINLLALLAENGKIKNIDGVINNFSIIMAAHRGDLPVEVITARPLEEADKSELQSTLKLFAKKGENILLTTKVDPSIIGGMIVSVGDKYVDMSVASKIKKYTDLLQTPA
ncbi:ATP synthase subunit O, mitochondrial [Diaphorina citri]|uniref:Oligomycin sensitivity conferral protein n=1 Tax=Diaphorina citri TaxID=121845 RepID=A0A1S4E9B2_DIACI|nr:ATP synthase subunit O, mitochondrial [Diaphorina citri]